MSYCRWGKDSDLYAYGSDEGFVVWTPAWYKTGPLVFETENEMYEYFLKAHEEGLRVPDDLLEEARDEIKKGGLE